MGLLEDLCSIHTVWILDEDTTKGAGGALARSYRYVTDLKCRLVPLDPSMYQQLGVGAADFPHNLFCTTDPNLTENNRVKFKGFVFRMKGLPKNPDLIDVYWKTLLTCKTEDNAVPIGVEPQELP